jgi:hypothetical protein
MNHSDLPPLPRAGTSGPQVCAVVRLYLAVLDDVPAEQVQVVSEHVHTCAGCATEHRLMMQAASLAADLTEYAPPPQVDQAILAAINTWSSVHPSERIHALRSSHRTAHTRRSFWLPGHVVAVALLLALLTAVHVLSASPAPPRAFALPVTLSWSEYVLYYSETKVGANGVRYRVNCYHDLGTGHMHVETSTGGGLDIIAVGDEQIMLGEDLVHHIAQWGANAWSVDDSLFNLTQLRHDLQTNRAVYEGMDRFEGQEVYRIRWKHGLVLLLDRRYQPVNVLRDGRGPGTGQPIYERLTLLPASQVPSTLWDTHVPPGFQMGRLPERP